METGSASHLRLRELREEHGWTQQEVADQLARLAWLRYQERVGVNADMVAKWERSDKRPSPRYRDLLSLLYGVSTDYLGIGPATPAKPATTDRAPATADGSLVTALGGAAAVLKQLGPAGGILQPRMFEVWKDDVMHRRALLKLLGLTPAIAGLPAMAEADRQPRSGKPTAENVADLDHLAGRYQTLYHSTPPAALLTPVVAHLQTLGDLLRQGPAPAERLRLLLNRARVSILAGRLAFFDLQDPMSARAYYNLALEAAREAGDHRQAAAALGHVAFIPAAEHGFTAALDYLRGAARQVGKHPHGPLSSWLCAVESEMHTNAGNTAAALAAVERARDALDQPSGPAGELAWFDYYNATRLAGFAGYATLRAGRLDDARTALTGALATMPRSAVKQRAVFLADLATVELRGNDLDQACRTAADAAEQLHQAGYATGAGRLREFRAALEPWQASAPVRVLDEQLAALA
jgi:transcriptional regulator with XRE-family HTH domain/tetratricopeptide (TPR) repeat protein